ncbi:MAG: spermidine/putrescine ABC transporter substrate-binding protein [Candidatus Viridilinea halotolerans]|uniref:Spermidine/putrescine ABC transporter substrate-binding protein n=1 Tax=Candidatus Viridilinea halotolerans TaxID=2491704 RepID=A0A426TVS8_9CHLR|nr:MAG: spermidine/putrescine ABC transporter substrate-binding protein [Candidatus Viridilinea halotolerans]
MNITRSPISMILFVLLLASCTNPTPQAVAPQPTATTSSELVDGVDRSRLATTLYFYNWGDYIDPGLLEQFEAEYGVKVVNDFFGSIEEMVAKVRTRTSGYDIVVPSPDIVQTLAGENLLQPIDKTLLANLRHLDPNYLNPYFDPDNTYSIPYMFGMTGIAYNSEFFPQGVTSWAALFDPAAIAAYQNQFSMLDDERETPGAALRFLGFSYNSTMPEELAQAQALLIAQKPFLAAYTSADVNRKLASGEYVIAHCWNGTAMQARLGIAGEFSGNPAINFVVPEEGGAIWMDNLVILSESSNSYTAHVFINFLLRPDIAAQNADYIGYATPNQAALPLISAEVQALYAAGFAPDDAMHNRLEWIKLTDDTGIFSDLWTVVKGE